MMRPPTSLFTKILFWFFLNLVLVAATLTVFFAFQSKLDLRALFGRQGADRLRAAGRLIAYELNHLPAESWSQVLERHADIHGVDFILFTERGDLFSSTQWEVPELVMGRVKGGLRPKPPPFLPNDRFDPKGHPAGPPPADRDHALQKRAAPDGHRPPPRETFEAIPQLAMQTRNPTRYWAGVTIPIRSDPSKRPAFAILMAVSATMTGNGFFFDPLPWVVVAAVVLLISVLFWVPLVRSITRPLARMTRATAQIAKGRFDVHIDERRRDEIGRLANSINGMAARLSALVTGQKRFLGDVAHELGSPIARIQFGLGALEQRVAGDNRERVADVMDDVDHLTKLVNELLAFSRAEMRSNTVKLDRVELLPVAQAAVKREATPATEIVLQIDPGLEALASAELLTRALSNLLRNAIKYTDGAGQIQVSAEKSADGVLLTVKDSGPGVPEEYLHRLFEPFFRPEAARDRDSGGVGLGLAIVKTCVETCKGSVSAANLKPNGFAVVIRLES